MRWARLFADLEAQAAGLAAMELTGEVAERTRIEAGRLTLVDRLGGALGHPVQLRCSGAGVCRGRLGGIGADWVLLAEDSAELLVPASSVLAVTGLGRHSAPPPGRAVRLGLRSVLRGIGRDRSPVRLVLTDGSTLAGTIDRVGADHLELAEHPTGEPRRAAAVDSVRAVPFPAIGVLRRW